MNIKTIILSPYIRIHNVHTYFFIYLIYEEEEEE